MTGLVKTLETQINESDTTDFEVGEQRARNMRYYTLQPLGNEQRGRSKYISPDVLDAVEGKKAIFSETFLSSRTPVKFSDCAYPGEGAAKTAYVNDVLKRNCYEEIYRDGWHDSFVEKRMAVMAEWFRESREESLTIQQPIPAQMLNAQLQQRPDQIINVDMSKARQIPMPTPQGVQMAIAGEVTLEIDDSYTKLSLIAQEDYFRDPNATYLKDAMYVSVGEEISRGVLIDLGYDSDQVMSLAMEYKFRRNDEDSSRKAHDQSQRTSRETSRIESQEEVNWYRTWTWLMPEDFDDIDGFTPIEGFNLYEIHWCNGEILKFATDDGEGVLAVRSVDELPIFEWTEMKISHAANGMCTSDVMSFNQHSQSGLKRLVYDNQQMRNTSRNLVKHNALVNPRDLLDNLIGANLFTKDMDAVRPLPAPELSPMTLPIIEMFKRDGEERSGLSSLAKGMNSDAIKHQNADSMIERLTNAGTRRVTAAARDFALTFVVPLSKFIVRMGMKYDKSVEHREVAGQQMVISPAQWQDDANNMEVAVALTPDEGALMSNKLLTMHSVMSQDEDMKISYGVQQKHALYDMVFDMMGVTDTATIMLAPNSPQYQQAAQQQAQQMQQLQQKQDMAQQMQLRAQQTQMKALESADQREWAKFDWDRTDGMVDNMLNQDKQDWTQYKDQQEIEIERSQKRAVDV